MYSHGNTTPIFSANNRGPPALSYNQIDAPWRPGLSESGQERTDKEDDVEQQAFAAANLSVVDYSFDDMHLQAGERVQIELRVGAEQQRLLTTLVGYADGESVLIRTPLANGLPLTLAEGEKVVVRAFSGQTAFAFTSTIQRVCTSPFAYVHLSYPSTVRGAMIRDALRVRANLAAQVTNLRLGVEARPVPAILSDISTAGASLDAYEPLGKEGDVLSLAFTFYIKPHDYDVNLRITAAIQTRREQEEADPSGRNIIRHGVRFQGLHASEIILLQNLVYQLMVDDHHNIA